MMGSAEGGDSAGTEEAFVDEKPVHKVRLTKGFWLGKCEVSYAQWQQYLQETGGPAGPSNQYPAEGIHWEEAATYCRHYGLSLPTEAQWEYAAAGPEARRYPWGNQWDRMKCCNEYNLSPADRTWAVDSFPQGASWCGALNMAGNVWEWCQDWYAGDYYANSPVENPAGPNTGTLRVLRGGSWFFDSPARLRCAYRGSIVAPVEGDVCSGFRCAHTP
jgi:formylglycine-generating enzyme required for sulfatase activity